MPTRCFCSGLEVINVVLVTFEGETSYRMKSRVQVLRSSRPQRSLGKGPQVSSARAAEADVKVRKRLNGGFICRLTDRWKMSC